MGVKVRGSPSLGAFVRIKFSALLALSLVSSLLAGCTGGIDRAITPWNQSRGDISNTDQKLAGPVSRQIAIGGSVFVGRTSGFTSPVIGVDGSVFVSTFSTDETDLGNAIVKVSGGATPAILQRRAIAGQLSTPAVDDSGNVFLTVFSRNAPAQVMGLTSALGPLWSYPIPGHVDALGPPKLFKLGNQTLIFVIVAGGSPTGAHLLTFNVGGQLISDTLFCASYHSGIGGIEFTLSPVQLGPPDVPAHGVAIRTAPSNGNIYIAAAADACGLVSILLQPGVNAADAPTLKMLEPFLESDHEYFNEPAITTDGTLVVTSEKDDWQSFRFWAYDLAGGNQTWGRSLPAWPRDSVALEPFQTASAYSLLAPSEAASAKLLRFDLAARDMTSVEVDNTASSIAIGGSRIFVVTVLGIQVFDLLLSPVGTVIVPAQSALAVGRIGDIYGVDARGDLFRLPP